MSRFLLELQEANRTIVRVGPDDQLHSSRDRYDSMPSFISSLGVFIHPDVSALGDDDDEEWHAGSCPDGEDRIVQASGFQTAASSSV
ncbi:hypothetical protein L227DRAFT_330347 [Lentinus tigrinus ALCF2SS1-6]|uniref:Uncharacterized protein n=1 Tax=Lentinus tigrinus ALCF2SS1-6 TaxID=1328759 RepID=A0A5C2SMG0_9APHY|nr:hypothetical protein L227DRAFT_330347 [Lentinus tigrinus ALCF2SS1-6]